MKLEIKHLACYLPYGLKMYHEDLDSTETMPWTLRPDGVDMAIEYQNKPILRPLKDLAKPEFEMDEISKGAIMFLDETANLPHNSRKSHIGSIQYVDMLKIFEWHFDIFGLIPQNLAIDINTLKKQPSGDIRESPLFKQIAKEGKTKHFK